MTDSSDQFVFNEMIWTSSDSFGDFSGLPHGPIASNFEQLGGQLDLSSSKKYY